MTASPVHITGAGVVGCVLMHRLMIEGIPFTWSDIEVSPVAWRASTGSACTDDFDHAEIWPTWDQFAKWMGPKITERVPSYNWDRKLNTWLTEGDSRHLNVQQFIEETRNEFATDRTTERSLSQIEIVTVGAMTCKAWWWGWSADATATVARASWIRRVVRQTRYLYPKPGTNEFYVGSTIQFQKRAKALETQIHIDWWKRDFADFIKEHNVIITSEPRQGWRPVGEPGKWEVDSNGDIEISPMSASGVKFSPMVANQIAIHLKSIKEGKR